ncbi:MAG: TPM domain-containing protein [Ignavibacteria bacterium]|nr:TPM domain-containing protein [Ignavibacteria bacterium]
MLTAAALVLAASLLFAQNDTSTFRSRADNPQTLRNYVVDETGTLSNSQVNALASKLKQFEDQTTNQLVVYVIPSLDGESLEEVSMSIAEKNKMGRKDRDNGVLLLIVKNDRKIRIEVGYGLEGALTDALSSSIIRNEIAPNFKQGRFYEGINAGTDAIISATKGEYAADKKPKGSGGVCAGVPFFVILIFMIIFIFIITSVIRNSLGRGRSMYGSRKGWSSIPWIISGGSSGRSSSWGSSGGFGGFSGGGGSFGGGGASGGW